MEASNGNRLAVLLWMMAMVLPAAIARADVPSNAADSPSLNRFAEESQTGGLERPELPARPGHPISREDALVAASKPLVWTTNTLTQADVQKREQEFRWRQWMGGYKEHGDHGAACNEEAELFIKTWLDRLYSVDAHADQPPTSQLAGKLAGNAACADPLVLTAAGVNSTEAREKIRLLELAVSGFKDSKYNAYVRLFATLQLASALGVNDDRAAALDAAALPLVGEALTDGSFPAGDQEQCAVVFVSGWGKDFFLRNAKAVIQAARDAGKPYEWLTLVLEGQDRVNAAWEARGHDWASKVTPQGWLGFYSNLDVARKVFSRAWVIEPSRPFAASEMIEVALGEQSGILEMRQWFDRAIAAQIDYPGAWGRMRNALLPRWYGTHQAMLALGVTALNTGRFDTSVPGQFINVVRDVKMDQPEPPSGAIYGRPEIWTNVQRVCEGYLASPPSSTSANAWRSKYAVMAYLAGQYQVARSQLELLNWNLAAAERKGWGVDLSLMNQEVAAHSGNYAGNVEAAEAARDRGDLDQALKLYNQLLAERRIGPRVRQFARCRAASLELEKRLQAGEWVDFLPGPSADFNWVFDMGQASIPTNGVVEMNAAPGGHLLYSRVRVGRNFEVKGTFEFVKSSNGAFQIGLVMGMPDFDYSHGNFNWYTFRIFQSVSGVQSAYFSLAWSYELVSRPVVLNPGPNTFTFRFHGDECSATVNGQEVFKDQKGPAPIKSSENGFLLGLGTYEGWHETVRYQDIQVRKISP